MMAKDIILKGRTSPTQKGLPPLSDSYSWGASVVWMLLKEHSWSCSSMHCPSWETLITVLFYWNYLVTEWVKKPEWNVKSVATSFLPPGHCWVFLIRISTSCHPSSNPPCPDWKADVGNAQPEIPLLLIYKLLSHSLSPKTTVFMVVPQPPSVPL